MHVFEPAWRCIYCGRIPANRKSLGKEHILPLSLGGTTILPRASCTLCSEITRAFEETCARTIFGVTRLAGNFPTRNPEKRPTMLTTGGTVDGVETEIDTPVEHHPIAGALLQFEPPGLLFPRPSTNTFKCRVRYYHFEKLGTPETRQNAFKPKYTSKFLVTPFAKMLAKVAHSLAVGQFGFESHEWLLPDVIVGNALNLPDYVGSVDWLDGGDEEQLLHPSGEPEMLWRPSTSLTLQEIVANDGTPYVCVDIGLFFDFSPKYRVLVAKSKPGILYSTEQQLG